MTAAALAVPGIIAPIWFTAMVILQGLLQPDYSQCSDADQCAGGMAIRLDPERELISNPKTYFVAVPVPRRDVVRGHVPEGAQIAPDFNRWSGVRLKALKDLGAGHSNSRPEREPSRSVYDRARETLQQKVSVFNCPPRQYRRFANGSARATLPRTIASPVK